MDKKNNTIKSMKITMGIFAQEIKNIQKKINNDSNNNNYNGYEEEEESLNNISLGNNLNISENKKDFQSNGININSNINNNINPKPINLNFEQPKDFNEEFLQNYDQFSPSWRNEVDKMNARRGGKN
jgi:hypothetical protein